MSVGGPATPIDRIDMSGFTVVLPSSDAEYPSALVAANHCKCLTALAADRNGGYGKPLADQLTMPVRRGCRGGSQIFTPRVCGGLAHVLLHRIARQEIEKDGSIFIGDHRSNRLGIGASFEPHPSPAEEFRVDTRRRPFDGDRARGRHRGRRGSHGAR